MRNAVLFSLLIVAGCTQQPVFTPDQGERVARGCIDSTQAAGVYSVRPGRVSASNSDENIPKALPVERLGGTRAGADAINACIQRQAVAVGVG